MSNLWFNVKTSMKDHCPQCISGGYCDTPTCGRRRLLTQPNILDACAAEAGISYDPRFNCYYDGKHRPWNPLENHEDAIQLIKILYAKGRLMA